MELESLQIQITSDAHNATVAINNLINRLTSLKTALSGFNNISFGNIVASANSANSSFRSLTTTISNLSQNMRTAKGSMTELGGRLSEIRVDSSAASSIETVAAAIRKLGSKTIVTATRNLPELTVTLRNFAKEINELGIVNFDTASMTGVISSIAKLGGKASTQATKNLPTISAQLQNFVRQMNQIGSFSFDMINLSQMVAAIGKLGSVASGRAVNNIPLLARNLKELFVTLSSAPNVSGNIIRMTEALANLSTGLGRTRGATSNASSGMNLFGKNVDSVRIKSFSLASAIGKVYATYWALFRGFRLLGDAIDISSSLTEVENVVRQTFGQYESLINNFAKHQLKNLVCLNCPRNSLQAVSKQWEPPLIFRKGRWQNVYPVDRISRRYGFILRCESRRYCQESAICIFRYYGTYAALWYRLDTGNIEGMGVKARA